MIREGRKGDGEKREGKAQGKHRIILETARVKYDFTVRRNITVILGDSATGKTTLINYLNLRYLMQFEDSDKLEVYVENEKRIVRGYKDYVHTAIKYV